MNTKNISKFVSIMNESFRLSVVVALANWASNNRYLRKALPMQSKIFAVYDDVITISLQKLQNDYCERFIDKNTIKYCTALMYRLQPILQFQVGKFDYKHYQFKIEIEYKDDWMITKDIMIKSL